MPSFGDSSGAVATTVGGTMYLTSLEPVSPDTDDMWVDPVARSIQVFTGTVWEDFYGTPSEADTLTWSETARVWVPGVPTLTSPDGTVFTLTVNDNGVLSATPS